MTIINPGQLITRQETIRSEKIDEKADGILIAYFSDVNYGQLFEDEKLDRMVKTINSYIPDIIIFGGDLLDDIETPMSQEQRDAIQNALNSLNASIGKFAVLGDEDCLNEDKAINLLENASFEVMHNEIKTISLSQNSLLKIVGLDNIKNGSPDIAILNSLPVDSYNMVVCHTPDLFDEVNAYNVDYMLAGHSRNGQVYMPVVNLFYRDTGCEKYYRGKSHRNNTTLDITSGVSQNKENVRLNSDPEIVLYKLKTK